MLFETGLEEVKTRTGVLNHESRDRDPGSQEKEEKKKLPYFSYRITDRSGMYLTLAL
jgi:hypothetical protein